MNNPDNRIEKKCRTPFQWSPWHIIVVLIMLLVIGGGVVIGILAARYIYQAGRGWFAALFAGFFCGGLGMVSIHLFLQSIRIFLGTTFRLRRTKEKMWGVIPVWMFFGMYGLLMFGGLILSVTGRITKSHICASIGDAALMIAFGSLGILVVIGLVILGWKKTSGLRKID